MTHPYRDRSARRDSALDPSHGATVSAARKADANVDPETRETHFDRLRRLYDRYRALDAEAKDASAEVNAALRDAQAAGISKSQLAGALNVRWQSINNRLK